MQANQKDVAAGGIFIAIGAFFALNAYFSLRIGGVFGMGPGFFPIALGVLLCIFGVIIALSALGKAGTPVGPVAWRGLVMVTASVLFFAFGLRTLGMLPALFISVMLAAASTSRTTLVGALAISAGLTIFCTLVFVYALSLPIPVIGPWLGGR